jgi:type III pantothenate kinase
VNVDLVADVGNSRIKWGVCGKRKITASASLPSDNPTTWHEQLREWGFFRPLSWAIGSVRPDVLEMLLAFLQVRGDTVRLLARHDRLPLEIRTDAPERVGIDRLLNAVAALAELRRRAKGRRHRPAIIVDAGTAVTVDRISDDGAFEGGAIFPGRRLMAAALHDYTSLLPLVIGTEASPPPIGKNTAAAIEAGIHHAVAGGINQLIRKQLGAHFRRMERSAKPVVFLTGGDAPLLQQSIDNRTFLWPEMTLEGLRLSAEAQP